MEVKYLREICGKEHGLSNHSKILWLESFIHKSEPNTWGFPKCYVVVHVLRPWMTCSVLCDRPCDLPMHDSFAQTAYVNHLANWCLWTIPMDELEMVIFAIPSILSQILAIQNNKYTQKHKYLHGKLFLLEGKNHGINSKSIHYYQINYNNSWVCLIVK